MGSNQILLDSQPLENLPTFRAMRQAHPDDLLRAGPSDINTIKMDRPRRRPRHAGD